MRSEVITQYFLLTYVIVAITVKVRELSDTLAGMKGNLKQLEGMMRTWVAHPLFERGSKTSTVENFEQMQHTIVTQRCDIVASGKQKKIICYQVFSDVIAR